MNLEERRSRIVNVALKLARSRGYDSLNLRDLADEAGIALGTLYKAFRDKEDILSAAIAAETASLRDRYVRRPAAGDTPVERIVDAFARLTRTLTRRPGYARAVMNSFTSNHPRVVARVVEHEEALNAVMVATLRGVPPSDDLAPITQEEATVIFLLRQVWFAGMVGWSFDKFRESQVVEHVREAAERLLPMPH
jgi:AcrR family transcriptional regulator